MGGRKTSKSGLVTNSGYMCPVSSYRDWRRRSSVMLNFFAIPGSHHTGSIAIFITQILPSSRYILLRDFYGDKLNGINRNSYFSIFLNFSLLMRNFDLRDKNMGFSNGNCGSDITSLFDILFEGKLSNVSKWINGAYFFFICPLWLLKNLIIRLKV